jgi:hypothetical protein
MAAAFTAAYDVYYKHYFSVSEAVRQVWVKGKWASIASSALQRNMHPSDVGKFMRAAMDFKHFCDFPNLFENKEIAQCLTALACFTEFLQPQKQIAIADTAFTGLYQRNLHFRKQWLRALRSIVDYVRPLNGGTVTRLATGRLNRRDALWLQEYDIPAILSKLAAAEAKEAAHARPSVRGHRVHSSHSQLETAHVLHSMRAVLDASSKF